jgi:hypothetical protein
MDENGRADCLKLLRSGHKSGQLREYSFPEAIFRALTADTTPATARPRASTRIHH